MVRIAAQDGGLDLSGRLLGSYRLEGVIGSGAFGRVYRARHVALDVLRAVKVMQGDIAEQPAFRARFLHEARTAANLSHPNIVSVLDFGVQDGVQYLVMEHIDSLTLGERLDRLPVRRRTGDPLLPRWVRDIASALDYAHLQGVVHRDLKPSNVLVRARDDRAMLTDFGIAVAPADQRLTRTGDSVGTYAYMSPEQCEGDRALTSVSDVYAFAAMLYELATGSPPFGRGIAAVAGHLGKTPPSVRLAAPYLSRQVDAVLVNGLAKAPEGRHRTAGELATAFLAAFSSQPDAAVEVKTTAPAERPVALGWVPPAPEEIEVPPPEPPRRRLPPVRLPALRPPAMPRPLAFWPPRLPLLRPPRLPRFRLPAAPRLPSLPSLTLPAAAHRRVAVVGVGAALLLVLALVAAGRALARPVPAPSPTPIALASPVAGSVGSPVTVDGVRLTVVRVVMDLQPVPISVDLPPAARVIAVEVRYDNIGSRPAVVSPFDWDVADAAGGVYQGVPLGEQGDLGQRELAPGRTARGRVGFVVPGSVERPVLRFNAELGGATAIVPLG